MQVYHARKSDNWETPPAFVEELEAKYGKFDLDAASTAENAKVSTFFDQETDGLSQNWFGNVFVNPPYSQSRAWIAKAWLEVKEKRAKQVVLLVAARTDTKVWHEVVFPHAKEVCFLRGRVRFWLDGAPFSHSAPFPSAVVVFEAKN